MNEPVAFLSYHFDGDTHRADRIRAMGVVRTPPALPMDAWRMVAREEVGYRWWVDGALRNAEILIVLVGTQTALRPRVLYEITRAAELGIPMLGVRIDQLVDGGHGPSARGLDPFSRVCLRDAAGRTFRPRLYEAEDGAGQDIQRSLASWIQHAWVWQGVRERRAAQQLRKAARLI